VGEIIYALEWTSEDTTIISPLDNLVRLMWINGGENQLCWVTGKANTKCESMVGIPVTLWNMPWKKPLSPISTWQVQNKMITQPTRLAAFIGGNGLCQTHSRACNQFLCPI
jgi:hypothetical protein